MEIDGKKYDLTKFANEINMKEIIGDNKELKSIFDYYDNLDGKKDGKLTYVSLYGLDEAKCKLACKLNICHDIMRKQDLKSDILEEIICALGKRAGIECI